MNNKVTQWWETCCVVQTTSFMWFELLGKKPITNLAIWMIISTSGCFQCACLETELLSTFYELQFIFILYLSNQAFIICSIVDVLISLTMSQNFMAKLWPDSEVGLLRFLLINLLWWIKLNHVFEAVLFYLLLNMKDLQSALSKTVQNCSQQSWQQSFWYLASALRWRCHAHLQFCCVNEYFSVLNNLVNVRKRSWKFKCHYCWEVK